jgi:hypothetical protein
MTQTEGKTSIGEFLFWTAMTCIIGAVLIVTGVAMGAKMYEGDNPGLNYREVTRQAIKAADMSYEYDVDVTLIFQQGKIIRMETSEVLLTSTEAERNGS